MLDGYEFSLCLTHDVDRLYKTFQAPYYAVVERDPSHLRSLVTSERPYWQFERVMEIEEELGVRSSFYFLNEKDLFRDKPPGEWVKPRSWMLYRGRYDPTDGEIVDVIQTLDDGGWEVGIHGSYDSYREPERLAYEKDTLESILGHSIVGGRQHYLNLNRPDTWRIHRELGLSYDASLGSSERYGFHHGYRPLHPFDDEFAVLPLTVMEIAVLADGTSVSAAKRRLGSILDEADENDAVMTVLWHPRVFNEEDFPGYVELYRWLIRAARRRDAWIGPCEEFYEAYAAECSPRASGAREAIHHDS